MVDLCFSSFGYQKWFPVRVRKTGPVYQYRTADLVACIGFGPRGRSYFLGVPIGLRSLLLAGFWDKRLAFLAPSARPEPSLRRLP